CSDLLIWQLLLHSHHDQLTIATLEPEQRDPVSKHSFLVDDPLERRRSLRDAVLRQLNPFTLACEFAPRTDDAVANDTTQVGQQSSGIPPHELRDPPDDTNQRILDDIIGLEQQLGMTPKAAVADPSQHRDIAIDESFQCGLITAVDACDEVWRDVKSGQWLWKSCHIAPRLNVRRGCRRRIHLSPPRQ